MNLRSHYVERTRGIRRRSIVRLILALFVLALAALGAAAAMSQTQRIVSVGGALTEIVYALGAEKQLVAVDTTSLFPEAALRLPKVGYARQLSSEGVLALRPTLVLAVNEAGPANAIDQIRATGVTIERTGEAHSFSELRNKINTVARAVGLVEAGRALDAKLVNEMNETTRWLGTQTSKPNVLFILSHNGAPQVSGEGTAASSMIELAGGVNAVSGFKGYKALTAEAAIAANPDVLLVTTQGLDAVGGVDKLLAMPGLALTPAGKSRRVVAMEALYMLGFGPRLPQATRELAMRMRALIPTTSSSHSIAPVQLRVGAP